MIAAVIITFRVAAFRFDRDVARAGAKIGRRNKTLAIGALVLGVVFFLAVAPGAYAGRLASISTGSISLARRVSERC